MRLHTAESPAAPSEIEQVRGLPTTTPARSIVDALQAGAQPEQVELAVRQALQRGLLTPRRLRQATAPRSGPVRRFLEDVLAGAAR